jgi:UDP-glucose 4-epimerase
MKLIVTGGAGFIGSNLVESLIDLGEIIIIDDLSTGRIDNVESLIDQQAVKFVRGSINNLSLLKSLFKEADCVFHHAAISDVPSSFDDPLTTNDVNINGTLNVLLAALDCNVEKVVYASSSSIYGEPLIIPSREDTKPNPLSPYAASKLAGEYYCKVFSETYGIKTISLRYFNVYGPKQNPYSQYAAVIPIFITRLLKNQQPIIFGDGNQTRDFTFIKDVVTANILAMKTDATGVFNIACNKNISITTLANTICDILNIEISPIYKKPRSGDIKHSLADITLAKEKLSYKPAYELKRGLKETMAWFQKNEIIHK